MSQISSFSTGIGPEFSISNEDLRLRHVVGLTRVDTGGVEPPTLGEGGGYSHAMSYRNEWNPWIDSKIIEPKYDGVAQYLGDHSNQPTLVHDYHMISMMRATDYLMTGTYIAQINAEVDTVIPEEI